MWKVSGLLILSIALYFFPFFFPFYRKNIVFWGTWPLTNSSGNKKTFVNSVTLHSLRVTETTGQWYLQDETTGSP